MKYKFILGVFLLIVLGLSLVSSEVGLGISPSKMREQVVAGNQYIYDVLVFNTGTSPMEISLSVEGELVGFTTIEPEKILVDPEPSPHELPIKNGQYFKVSFDIPKSGKDITYTGTISATGKGTSGSQFGGSVGVNSQIELVATPPQSIFARLSTTHYIIVGAILLIILLIVLIKRSGIKISISKSSNSKKKK